MQPHAVENFDEFAVHHYTFSPRVGLPNFAFNVDGVDVILVSLTCGLPLSPPSPPLLSPSPPSPQPPVITSLPFTHGLRSVASRSAVGVIALILVLRLASSLAQTTSITHTER